jgi:Helix-turn-helix domain
MAAPRVCSVCRTTRLSRFNPGSVCSPCARAARHLDSVSPAWLWDSQPMRQALARLDPGAVLAIFRTASGLSQQEVAEIMGWSQSTVSLIEKGQRDTLFDLREVLRFADTVDMPREALTPLLMGDPDATPKTCGDDGQAGEDVDRRSFGGFAVGAAAALILPDMEVPTQVTPTHIQYLRSCSDTLCRQEQIVGGAGVLRQSLRAWQRARRMLEEGSYSDQTGRELMSAAGDLAIRAGWASYDSGDQRGLARQLYTEALLLLAGHAGDDALAVHVLENMTLQSLNLARAGRPGLAREAIKFSERAAELARRDPAPRLHALIAAREAVAYSLLGDSHGFRATIGRAWRELERGHGKDDPLWLRFMGPAEAKTHEARGLAFLSEAETAVELCQGSLQDPGLAPRNRAFYHAQLASTLAACGDATSAVSEGLSVLPALESQVASLRTLRELSPVRSAAGQIGAEEFCERFDQAICAAAA